ncbi:MAG: hypothetical protein ACTSRZ_10825 [Promethearchaeota archaeon]
MEKKLQIINNKYNFNDNNVTVNNNNVTVNNNSDSVKNNNVTIENNEDFEFINTPKFINDNEIYNFLLNKGLTKDDIEKLVRQQIMLFSNFIGKSTALFMIGYNYGFLSINQNIYLNGQLIPIEAISLEKRFINCVGKVSRISKPKTFVRKDGGSGFVAHFFLRDRTGEIKVVLWDEHVDILGDPKFKVNSIVKIKGGIVKKSNIKNNINQKNKIAQFNSNKSASRLETLTNNSLEIHSGSKTIIELNPHDAENLNLPEIKEEYDSEIVQIGNISLNQKKINVYGVVLYISNEISYKGDKKLRRITIKDDTGIIDATIWNEQLDIIEGIEIGDKILLRNFSVRQHYREPNKLILNSTFNSAIELIENRENKLKDLSTFDSIGKGVQNEGIYNFKGIIDKIFPLRKIEKTNKTIKIFSLNLKENNNNGNNDWIRIVFWNDDAEKYSNLRENDKIQLYNIRVKYNDYNQRNEGIFCKISKLILI